MPSSPLITQEAARTQRSPVINTETSATPEPDLNDEWEDFLAMLEGMEEYSELMDMEGDQLLEEAGTAGENASVKEDRDPHVELQEPRVRHLAMLEEAKFSTHFQGC